MNLLTWALLFLELTLLAGAVILEFTKYSYFCISKKQQVLLRIILHFPIFILVIAAPESLFKWLMLVSFSLMFIAEMLIIFDFLQGFIANFVFNIFNIIMLTVISRKFSFTIFAFTIGAGALIYFTIFFKRIKGIFALTLPLYLLVQLTAVTRAANINEIALIGCIFITLCDIEIGYTEFIKKFPLYQQLNFILWFTGQTLFFLSLYF